jgi:hypothetical protein
MRRSITSTARTAAYAGSTSLRGHPAASRRPAPACLRTASPDQDVTAANRAVVSNRSAPAATAGPATNPGDRHDRSPRGSTAFHLGSMARRRARSTDRGAMARSSRQGFRSPGDAVGGRSAGDRAATCGWTPRAARSLRRGRGARCPADGRAGSRPAFRHHGPLPPHRRRAPSREADPGRRAPASGAAASDPDPPHSASRAGAGERVEVVEPSAEHGPSVASETGSELPAGRRHARAYLT